MGEPHQFGSSFPTQPNMFTNDSRNVTPSQEPAISEATSNVFSTPTVFGSSYLSADASGNNAQESSTVQLPPNLFSNPSVNSVLGTSSQTLELGVSKNTIFGGSAFSKPTDSAFAAAGRQSIFGGAHLNNPQPSNLLKADASANVSQTSFFGRSQMAFGGASSRVDEEVTPAQNNIFGGQLVSNHTTNLKPNPFDSVNSLSLEQASSSKISIFGGAYTKKDEHKPAFSHLAADVSSDNPGEVTNISSESHVSSGPLDKLPLFSSSKSAFGRFSSSGTVSSTLSNRAQERSGTILSSDDVDKKSENQPDLGGQVMNQKSAWEADSIGEENEEFEQRHVSTKSAKIVRKRGVFGKAIEDVAKSSTRSQSMDETRSVVCYPLDGDLTDSEVLKDHFSRYGTARVTLNKEKRYCVATYKTHQEAEKAMKGKHVLGGVKYKFFWRNMTKARRKSVEDGEKQKPLEEKKIIKRPNIEIDDAVREELAAISGIDYLVPQESTSKRKSVLEREARKKSRPQSKKDDIDLAAQEGKEESYESGKRSISHFPRTEGSKDLKSRTAKVSKEARSDEKLSLRSRIGTAERLSSKKTSKEEADESKPEKVEQGVQESISTAVTSELLETLKQQSITSEEKLRVLEARDKLIRLKQVKQYDISKAVKTVGTCPDMCPEKERLLRETRRQISQYEMSSSKVNEMDPSLMVKQYSRSSADQEEPLPHDLRPPAVLTRTMNYLMHTIMNLGDEPGENLGDWYHFLWDRLRGIRKEITQQELCDADAVSLVEQCARFHIHCGARLVAEDMSVFDDRINTENLTKCLQTLKHMYHDLWMNNSITCQNEPEFITYFLLLNLNNGTIMWEMEQLREEVLKSPEIGFVAAMYNSLSSNNFIRFFRLVRKASYLNSCLCIRYFYQVRAKALSTYIKALAKARPVNYPLASLVEGLGFENAEHAAAFCNHHGLHVESSSSNSACVILSQETFDNPSFVLPSERAFALAESKKFGTVGEVVYGGTLPPRSYENHAVHLSFDENGYLRKSAYYARDQGLIDTAIREEDDNVFPDEAEVPNKKLTHNEIIKATVANVAEDIRDTKNNFPQNSEPNFESSGSQKLVFPSSFSNSHTKISSLFNAPTSKVFKTFTSPLILQTSENPESIKSNIAQMPGMLEPIRRTVFQQGFMDQTQAKIEAEKKALAELEMAINECSEFHMQELIQSSIQEVTAEIALLEWKAAEEQHRAEEQQRAEEQLRAQEELRRRVLETHVDRISKDSLCELVNEIVEEMVSESAQDVHNAEVELVSQIRMVAEESLESLVHLVAEELSYSVASDELKRAQEFARKEAVKHRVRQVFYFWLERARRSLHRRRVMEDFPASVIQLSVKEHAERWGISADVQTDVWESCTKGNDKVLDIPELKAMPAYPQIAFAELIGIQAVHRYDTVRAKLGLRPTDKLLFKLFVSVPEDSKDPASQLIDWWVRRTFKQNCSMLCDDVEKGVYRIVSGVDVTSEVSVYASLQMVKGSNALEKQTGLVSGTSAVMFSVSPTSNIQASRARLAMLLRSLHKLPAIPLVIAIVSPSEPPVEGLKQLVFQLELDRWLQLGIICDYQILHVEDQFDLKYLAEHFSMAFNYMVMTWTPTTEFSLVYLKNVLRSTFQMFYISIQFNYNSSEVYPRDVDDPRVIIGICNEWLDHMCNEFVSSYHEARELCGEEFWPLLHNGAYLPFLNKPRYEQLLQEVIRAVSLPQINWPPSSEEEFESLLTQYCSWLRPDDRKQTLRRLSCLNGLTWPEKMKSIPWVNLIEDWMEARINYIETSIICGTELLCLMREQNVEHLYTYSWWAQSKHLIAYLESSGSGWECDMDVDQTVPIEKSPQEEINVPQDNAGEPKRESSFGSDLNHFQEVSDCVSELKKVNESFITRLRSALDDPGTSTVLTSSNQIVENELAQKAEKDVAPDLESYVKNIDLQVKVHQDLRSNISKLLSKALAEDNPDSIIEIATESESSEHNSTKSDLPVMILNDQGEKHDPSLNSTFASNTMFLKVTSAVTSEGRNLESSNKMDEIMASANDIVSSLNQKYKILDSTSRFSKISDLKMGLGNVDTCSLPEPSDKLDHSAFVEQSQQRMMAKLQTQASGSDYDSDAVSDERSESTDIRTVSSLESESVKSVSDVEENEFSDSKEHLLGDESEDENYTRSNKKRLHSNDSEDDDHSNSRRRRHHNDSESDNYSAGKVQNHHDDSEDNDHSSCKSQQNDLDSEDEDYCSRDVGRPRHHSEDEASYEDSDRSAQASDRSAQASDSESAVEEIQTISSDESRDSSVPNINLNAANNESHAIHDHNPFSVEENQPQLNSDAFDVETATQNGLVVDHNSDSHFINLDNVHHQYEYYGDDGGVHEEDPVYTVSSEISVLQSVAESEVVVSNCEPEHVNEPEQDNEILLPQHEPSSEDKPQNVYEVEEDSSDQECNKTVPDYSEDTYPTTSEDGEDHYDHSKQQEEFKNSVKHLVRDSSSDVEEYDDFEEEEVEEEEEEEEEAKDEEEEEEDLVKAEVEADAEAEDEDEEETGEGESVDETGEEEADSEPESEQLKSEPDDDSDVCEVIDDD